MGQKKLPARPAPSKQTPPSRNAENDSGGASKAAYPIAELTATGSERYDVEDILKATGLRADKTTEVPLERVREAAENLVATGAFAQVSYKHMSARGGMRVELTLGDKDDDQFIKCDFGDIVWMPESDLLVELHDRVPLFNGTVPRDGSLADDVAKALEAVLKEKNVAATVTQEHVEASAESGAGEVIAYRAADVDIRIAQVEIPGASGTMKAEVQNVGKKLQGLAYHRSTVAKFVDGNLHTVYLQHGYLRAGFGAPIIKVASNTAQRTDVEIAIPVTEGRSYKLGEVRWAGNNALVNKTLDSAFHFADTPALDGTRLNRNLNAIRALYASMGFLHMTVTPKPQFDDASGIVNYVMQIKEGDLFTMGKFDVEGLQNMSAERMKQAWKLREGDPFDPLYLRDFFKKFRMPAGTAYIVEEAEGERPKSVDVTVIFCQPTNPCKPTKENHLYTPPVSDEEKP